MNTYLLNKKRCSKCNNIIKKGFKIPCRHFVCEKCIIDKPKCNICKIKFNVDNISSCYWWLRTPYPDKASGWTYVGPSGTIASNDTSYSYGVAPAFCI